MNILVIGANGFIGHHAADYFAKQHDRCILADTHEKTMEKGYIRIDKDIPDFDSVFREHDVDVCINASGCANVSASFNDPATDSRLNYQNVELMLEAIRKFSPKTKYITLSSAAVYGTPQKLPVSESDKLVPVSPYGYHKMFSEMACEMYSKYYGIRTYALRLFSLYGIGQKKLLIWDLVNKFAKDEEVHLFGTGKESRDYISIEDAIRAIALFVYEDIPSGVYNVANGEEITVSQVALLVKKYMDSPKKIVYSNEIRKGDPLNWRADVGLIESYGYKKSICFEDGIKQYVEWAKEQI